MTRDPDEREFRAAMRALKLAILRGPIDEITQQLITVERPEPIRPLWEDDR